MGKMGTSVRRAPGWEVNRYSGAAPSLPWEKEGPCIQS